MKVNKKTYWIIVLIYSAVVLSLKYIFHSPIGEFFIQIGYLAIVVGVVCFGITIMKEMIKNIVSRKKR